MAGLPKKYAKMGFKKGWKEYKKTDAYKRKSGKSKSGGTSKSKSKSSSKSGGKRRMGNSFNTRKLFSVLRMVSLVLPGAAIAVGPGTPMQKLQKGGSIYTGIGADGVFRFSELRKGYEGYFWTSLATYGIPKLISFVKKVLG